MSESIEHEEHDETGEDVVPHEMVNLDYDYTPGEDEEVYTGPERAD